MARHGVTVVRKKKMSSHNSNGDPKKKPTVKRKRIYLSKKEAEAFKKRKGIDLRVNPAGGLVGKGATGHLESKDPITKKKGKVTIKRIPVTLTEAEKKRIREKK